MKRYKCKCCGKICDTKPEEMCVVTADMSGAELRILAELSGETIWLDAFNRGEDVHEVCAEMMYPKEWPGWAGEGCAYYQLKEDGTFAHKKCECLNHKDKRDEAKVPNFLIPYGGGAPNLASQTGKTVEEAQEILDKHRFTFPTLWQYLERSGKEAKFNHEARDMFGRRRLFPQPTWETAKRILLETAQSEKNSRWEKCMRKEIPYGRKWDDYLKFTADQFQQATGRKPKKDELYVLTHNENPLPKHISSMLKGLHERIERQGKNHAIQGTNATIAKAAMGCGYCKNGKPFLWHTLPQYKAKLLAFVHDELVIQCPTRFGQIVADLVGDAFKRAAAEKMTKLVMEFDFHIAGYWKK